MKVDHDRSSPRSRMTYQAPLPPLCHPHGVLRLFSPSREPNPDSVRSCFSWPTSPIDLPDLHLHPHELRCICLEQHASFGAPRPFLARCWGKFTPWGTNTSLALKRGSLKNLYAAILTMKEVMEMIRVSETTMKRLTNVETGVFAVITASGYRSKGSRKMIRRQELEWYLQGGADAVR
jgi:hypothetical protein